MQQIYGTTIETKFASPYACIFKDRIKIQLFESEHLKPWSCYDTLTTFYYGPIMKKHLKNFLLDWMTFSLILTLHESESWKPLNFPDIEGEHFTESIFLI